MHIMKSEWRDRLKHWIRVLKEDFYEPLGEIQWQERRVWDHLSLEEALNGSFEKVSPGYTWGYTWEYCWFKGQVIIPREAEGKRIVMDLQPEGETTIFVNGQSFGTYRSDKVFPVYEKHHFMEDNVLTRAARAGEAYEILMETYAGHHYPDAATGGIATGPVMDGMYADPLEEGRRRTLGRCTYGIWNEDAYQLYMDVDTLSKSLETMDHTSLRASKIADALESFTMIVDFEQSKEARTASYINARAALRPVMEAVNGSTQPVFYAIGHGHIDLAWLWPFAETHRKTARTFAAQLRLIDEYPEYKYIQSQPAAYEMLKKYYPELFVRVKEAAKKGQWIADGAMWVEPDTNLTSGESLVRQLLYGKRYYKEEFDVDSQLLWLPDTFGYSAALPQILKGFGVKYLVTQKIFWSYNEGEQFPYHYFTWKGMDGSDIVSFLPTNYNYRTNPVELNHTWKNRSQMRDLDAFLLPYGYGDGGGGPCRDHVEYALRQKDLEGGVKVKLAGPMEFFEDMEKAGGPKDTYEGELYFACHRGTYTSQAMVKKNNRKSELALREAELWSALSSRRGYVYPKDKLDELWKEVLLYQFHDILPGSCIGRVYEEVEAAYERILRELYQLSADARSKYIDVSDGNENRKTDAVAVFNSLGFVRSAVISLPESFKHGAVLSDGRTLPVYVDGKQIKTLVTLPACGMVSLHAVSENDKIEGSVPTEYAQAYMADRMFVLENAYVKAVVNGSGEVVSFVLNENGYEYAAGAMNRFRMYKDVPRLFDAWDIDSHYIDQEISGAADVNVKVISQGAEAVLKVTGKIGASGYTQYIRLAANSRRLEFDTEVDWKELHRLLKVSFPVEVRAQSGINEIQFGYLERPTHRSRQYDKDRFEVCNHKYSALCDYSHGAAVLNDCKYGISMNENALELTLLRAPSAPEMQADNRVHHFIYAFTAWEGTFMDCDVVQQGYELNVKPTVVNGAGSEFSFIQIEKENIILDTVKLAEDRSGDIILRLYEAKNAVTRTDISVNLDGYTAYECDMMENILTDISVDRQKISVPFRNFEIKTIRIKA